MFNAPINDDKLRMLSQSERASDNQEMFLVTHPWIRHYEQGVPASITVPDHPLTWLLDHTAHEYPEHTALIYAGKKLTYAQLLRSANCFARELLQRGVKKGDRVAIALPNIPQYPIAFYGVLKAGAIAVPTNPLYTGREMQHQLTDSDARAIVMLDTFYPTVRTIRDQTALEHVFLTTVTDFLPLVPRLLYPLSQWRAKRQKPLLTPEEVRNDPMLHMMHPLPNSRLENAVLPLTEEKNPSDLAVLQYTGGTTGIPKGAMLTHHNLLANAVQIRSWFPRARTGEEVILCVAPFFHAYGMTTGMNASILMAATMVLVPRFRPDEVVRVIRQCRPTFFPGIPTMYLALLRGLAAHPKDVSSVHYCISGSAPLPARVQADFEAVTQGRLVEGYGLSEAGPVTHCNPFTDECRNGSIGLPLPGVEAAIVDLQTGLPVSPGEVGELIVKGPNVMQGYWRQPGETQTTLINGWLHTGDLAKMDKDGYCVIVERIKDVIIASGLKIYPREVEEVLYLHPAVSEAAVTGAPHPYRGETVAAFVVLKAGIKASDNLKEELREHCARELAAYKVPTIVEFRQNLPKSLINKVIRRELHVAPS